MTETLSGLVGLPASGRVVRRRRPVRVADTSPGGRLRLDAVARHLQDVSSDDTAEVDLTGKQHWVVRRLVIDVPRFPRLGESLELATWCAAIGSHYAERRVSVLGDGGGQVEASALWVHIDPRSGRPKRLPPEFADLYGEAAAGRRARARLEHGGPPAEALHAARPWPLRFTDFDVLGHVNNSVYWSPVEELLAERRHLRAPMRAAMEHRGGLDRGAEARVAAEDRSDGSLIAWLLDGADAVAASAVVSPLG